MANTSDKIIKDYLSQIIIWIDKISIYYKRQRIPVIDFNFKRLHNYFEKDLLKSSHVVIVNGQPPVPKHLFKKKLSYLSEFFNGKIAAITYNDTYYVRKEFAQDESLHFHELIHVIQWEYSGFDKMLVSYMNCLMEDGYRNSFFEDMAYRHQKRFDFHFAPYDVKKEVLKEMRIYYS